MCACLVDLRHIGRSKLYLGAGSLGASPGPILAEEPALLGLAQKKKCVGGVGELALPGTLGALLNLALHMVQPDPLPTALTGPSAPGMTIYIFLSVIG